MKSIIIRNGRFYFLGLMALMATFAMFAAMACGTSQQVQPTIVPAPESPVAAPSVGAGQQLGETPAGSTPAAIPETSIDRTGWPEMVRLGLIPTEADELTRWQPVVDHLEAELDVKVEPFVGTDYTATIIAAKNGDLDVVWLGPKSYVKARNQGAQMEPVVRWISEDTGIAGYNSLLITHKDSGISTLDDAQGRTFAFNEPESTSGFLVPTVFFLEQDIEPESYFSEVFFAGSHEATAVAVANNTVDLASNNNETLPRLIETGRIAETDVKIIWESPLIPTDPISVQMDLPETFREAVREAFLKFNDLEAMDVPANKGLDSRLGCRLRRNPHPGRN